MESIKNIKDLNELNITFLCFISVTKLQFSSLCPGYVFITFFCPWFFFKCSWNWESISNSKDLMSFMYIFTKNFNTKQAYTQLKRCQNHVASTVHTVGNHFFFKFILVGGSVFVSCSTGQKVKFNICSYERNKNRILISSKFSLC